MASTITGARGLGGSGQSLNIHKITPYLYVLPALAALALWNYYPLFFLVDLSFRKLDASSPVPTWKPS